ncbi:MAG TPA: aldose epimerase family protein [Dongiaceae bacterium]|nr:aldose epimerase family protein [Dongiaceae bacterium]
MSDAVTEIGFGTLPDGRPVKLFTLRNAAGLLARITNFGTIITELHVPDRQGRLGDVVLGFDRLETYLADTHYLGCTVGRVANRTAKGRFTLDGKTYKLAVNNGSNHLHGGLQGFDRALWHAVPQKGAAIQFTHTSPDGDEGYPGKLEVTVLMTLTDANELRIDYTATTDRATPINLTNHSYFNFLGGGDILGHELMLAADHYTPVDDTSIPVGEIRPVAGGPMDFNQRQPIGARFNQLTGERIGYDHNYVLRGGGKSLALAAQLYEPQTGRFMEVLTTEPGIQVYTGNWLDGTAPAKGGKSVPRYAGIALETQHFPDSINQAQFPSVVLRPGQTFRSTTIYRFATQ